MFSSSFIVIDTHLKHLRGEAKLTRSKRKDTIATSNYVENSFCSICGTLVYRRSGGLTGISVPRIGTTDDFSLQKTKFKLRVELFERDRCAWLSPAKVEAHVSGADFMGRGLWKSIHHEIGGWYIYRPRNELAPDGYCRVGRGL